MMFPSDLKDRLQELAGPRNLTSWVLNAVYDKLEQKAEGALEPTEAKKLEAQLLEARDLAQALADAIAATDDDPNPQRALQGRELPDWLSQKDWPLHLKAEARPTPVVVEPEPVKDWVDDPDLSREETLAKFKALGPEPTVGPEGRNDLLARVQAKAKELGLVTAASIPIPDKPAITAPELADLPHDVQTEPVYTEPAPLSQIKDPNACSACGSELVEGECWWCS